jgi:hypothetical protein
MRGKGKPFKKGAKPGPGRKPLPEDLKGVKELTPEVFRKLVTTFWDMPLEEIEAIATDPSVPMLRRNLATVILKIDEYADVGRFEFLLNRTIGKVVDKSEVEHKHQGQIDHALRAIPRDILLKLARESGE